MRKFTCTNCDEHVECLGVAIGHMCDVQVRRDGSRRKVAKRFVQSFVLAHELADAA